MKTTAFIYSDSYLKHKTPFHPESKERLKTITGKLKASGLWDKLLHLEPEPASPEQVAIVHSKEYIAAVARACRNGVRNLDPDTMICKESYNTALLAGGGVIKAVDTVMSGKADNAFCAVRPPGHHAEYDRAMGFCLFNNVAIAAHHAQRQHDCRRVFIVDWDAHHGNGTQNAFYGDPDVYYFSLHQYPLYPGSGKENERGKGRAEGTTLNVPLAAGAGDKEFLEAMEKKLLPAAKAFAPSLFLISAGFDCHSSDPLAALAVTTAGLTHMCRMVKEAAEEYCQGKLISVLEGGYNLQALGEAVLSHVKVLLEE